MPLLGKGKVLLTRGYMSANGDEISKVLLRGLKNLESSNPSAYGILIDDDTISMLGEHQTSSSLTKLANRLLETLELEGENHEDQGD